MDPKITLVNRLWQYARMRSVGADDNDLASAQILIRSAMTGIDPIRDREDISGVLYAHIVENAVEFYTGHSCFGCRFREACPEDSESCSAYESDMLSIDSCRDELIRTIKVLDRVFGLKADLLIHTLNAELSKLSEFTVQPDNL